MSSRAVNRFTNWFELGTVSREHWHASSRERAKALNERLNAMLRIELANQVADGPLLGLPYGVKDMIQSGRRKPTGGLVDGSGLPIEGSSTLLERLDRAGGDLVCFTGMTELASEPSGFNAVRGRVKNPWNLGSITGGSSSGSAAAVASGAVAVAIGSDTGGSVRIPAFCCGITAWKSTYGLVATAGTMPLAPTLDTIGLLGRSAADILPAAKIVADLPSALPIRRIAMIRDALALCAPAIQRGAANLADALALRGAVVEHRNALAAIEAVDAVTLTILFAESGRVHRGSIDDESVEPTLRRRLAKGLEVSDQTLNENIGKRDALIAEFEGTVMAGVDAAIVPIMAITTPTADECQPGSPNFSGKTLYALSRFTRFVNLLGYPSVAVPAGFDADGMPVGVQIIGRRNSDRALLELVEDIQRHSDWHNRVPTAVADLVRSLEPLA
jgi:aspartyl-tRNA(Asn)/glutamyl-tRNA(Gln) amidotransferase subunit A